MVIYITMQFQGHTITQSESRHFEFLHYLEFNYSYSQPLTRRGRRLGSDYKSLSTNLTD